MSEAATTKPHWSYLALLGLTPLILGVMITVNMSQGTALRNDFNTLTRSVAGLREDMAVVKNTIQSLIDRDIPSRKEIAVIHDQIEKDMKRHESQLLDHERRIQLMEQRSNDK